MGLQDFLHKRFVKTTFAPKVDLSAEHVIVTGASEGSLGYETAKTLAAWGASVIVTTRKPPVTVVKALQNELSGEAKAGLVDGYELDLCHADSVNSFTNWYLGKYGQRLDILVNNAGIHQDLMSKRKGPLLTADGHEIHWRTNYLGTVHLTHKLLPLLRKTSKAEGDARIINVGSQIHSKGSNESLFDPDRSYNSWQAYGNSKLALIHFSNELHRRFSETDNLKSFCVHPGGLSGARTNIADKGFEGHNFINAAKKLGGPLERIFMATAEEGAQTQIYCAVSPEAEGGHYYQDCVIKQASADAYDEGSARRLWRDTADWVKKLP